MNISRLVSVSLIISFALMSCSRVSNVFKDENPRENYVKSIQKSPFAQNDIVQQWLAESDSVLHSPVDISVPFQSKVVYFSDEANAWALQFDLSEGRTIRAHASKQDSSHQLFIELFSTNNGKITLEQSTNDSLISYTLDEDQTLTLRVQPELFVNGSATITLTDNPSMEFPVKGGIRADIGSFWGDPRDGGSRRHEGVDIFAERGTPVVAAADGRVTRTGNRGLGGKQVWLRANGRSLYYAHLDSINSGMLESVQKGDTLGFVGNSGNARTTPTHLHFGIYDRGATNPLPFIDFASTKVEPITAEPSNFPKWARVAAAKANVRPLPSTEQAPLISLTRNNPVNVIGGTGEWYQVKLPDGRRGFIYQSLLQPATPAINNISTDEGNGLFKNITDLHPMLTFNSPKELNVYAAYENQHLIRYRNRWMWMKNTQN